MNQVDLSFVKSSVAINNSEAASGGREKEDIETLRQNAMASFASQNRAITREDYIVRCYSMPRKFGSVSKAYIIGDMQQDSNDTTYPRDTISNPLAFHRSFHQLKRQSDLFLFRNKILLFCLFY